MTDPADVLGPAVDPDAAAALAPPAAEPEPEPEEAPAPEADPPEPEPDPECERTDRPTAKKVPGVFADATGREWPFVLDKAAVAAVRDVAGVDLRRVAHTPGGGAELAALVHRPARLREVLWLLAGAERGVDLDGFMAAHGEGRPAGPAAQAWAEAAFKALWVAVARRWPGSPLAAGAGDAADDPDPGRVPLVVGTAHLFGRLSRMRADGTGAELAVYVRPGAVDASLERVRRGAGEVELWVGHDRRRALCGTGDGSLELWADRAALYFAVRPATARGRRAAAFVAAHPELRRVSIGGRVRDRTRVRAGVDRWQTPRVDLEEVSLVERAGCPGTSVELVW